MSKEKDTEWYDKKMKDLKNRKRASCGSIPEGEYDPSYINNKRIKKMKEEFKKEKRSFKRAEKRNWKKKAQEEIDKYYDD